MRALSAGMVLSRHLSTAFTCHAAGHNHWECMKEIDNRMIRANEYIMLRTEREKARRRAERIT